MKPLDLFDIPLEGAHLIEASAGTGKTYTIASLFLRLLLERRMTVRQILVVTYTVPATDELKIRIRDKLRTARQAFEAGISDDPLFMGLLRRTDRPDIALRILDTALRQFDEASIFTIHGFCHRVIADMAFESGNPFESELISDESEFVMQAVSDFFRMHFTEGVPRELISHASKGRGIIDTFLSLAKKASLDAEVIPEIPRPGESGELAPWRESFMALKTAWPSLRQGFTDLLLNSPAIKHDKYRIDRIPAIIASMDEYLSTDGSALPLFRDFEKFTPQYLDKSVKRGFEKPRHEVYDLAGELRTRAEALRLWMDRYLVWIKTELIRYLRQALPERKEALGILSFDDLLLRMHRAVSSVSREFLKGIITERYRAVLIDEFQDTDPIQARIFTSLFSGTPLYFIGDPKQAIYTFRGADIFAYLNAAGSIDEGAQHTLSKNFRSEPGLIQAVNTLFGREKPFVFDEIRFRPVEPAGIPEDRVLRDDGRAAMTIWYVSGQDHAELAVPEAEQRITRAVTAEVSRLLREGRKGRALIGDTPVMPRDIAVIVRKHRQGRLMRDSLAAWGIPSVISSEESVFRSDEAGVMDLVLRAVAEPLSGTMVRTALATPLFGCDAGVIEGLSRDEAAFELWTDRFREYREIWLDRGFMAMFRRLMGREGVRSRLLRQPGGERMLTNYLHLSESLNAVSLEDNLGMKGLISWLSIMREGIMPGADEHQLRLESDDDAVRIITVHKSKGLEFPIVFCPFLWGSSDIRDRNHVLFHDPDMGYRAFFDVGSDSLGDHCLVSQTEALAEDTRLAYVAVTRARNRCYLAWGKINRSETSALYRLLHEDGRDPGRDMGGSAVREDLEALCDAAGGVMSVEDLPQSDPERHVRDAADAGQLRCRTLSRDIDRTWRVTSFTAMTAPSLHYGDADRDLLLTSPSGKDLREEGHDIFGFPRGARAGTMIHEIFENIDFDSPAEAREGVIREVLAGHGYAASWLDVLSGMVRRVLCADLGGFSLSSVRRENTLRELEFTLPVDRISPEILGQAFRASTSTSIPPSFPARMEALGFEGSQGFLRGFMDLVFSRGKRYYLVDWKSNHLGNAVEDYGREALDEAMERDCYILQYHLYTLALHRYLEKRVPGYSFAEHFGGIIYVFVRGVDPDRGPGFGIYRRVPEEGLVNSMAGLILGGGDGGRGGGHD